MVPLLGIFDAAVIDLKRQIMTKTINGTKGGLTIILRVGERTALKSTEKITLDVLLRNVRGRILVLFARWKGL